ncbi:MAG: helix-turn-helix domain-containing protein [Clostridia bacterium]|nr:helix-turn-helix domain-containing protein [Clostridia bacterium]MBQ7089584.1 helix-turn-helix domain-containing protein [Clostridia bacterium]
MNDTDFFNGFVFNEFSFAQNRRNDNTGGIIRHYIGYLKQGAAVLISERERIELEVGDLFYIPKGCRYQSEWSGAEGVCFDSLGFDYFPSRRRYRLQKLRPDEGLLAVLRPLSADKRVDTAAVGRLYTLLGLMEPLLRPEETAHQEALIEQAMAVMAGDLHLPIPQVAAACKVSEATLYNTFRKGLGQTPNTMRRRLLCKEAARLLGTTNLSVEAVSDRCGFSSASYFRKILFRVMGKTPTQIRKEAEY